MSWKNILKEDWPQRVKKDKRIYYRFKVIGKNGYYRNPDVKELSLTIEEANKLKHSCPSEGGFDRQYKGNDPRSRYNR